jgi:poly(A) polymerase
MSTPLPTAARSFAVEVVRTLRTAGYEAFWAGGCVRDQLLGLTPKDYDVATNARPERIRELFGFKRTLAIGAAFGVITVLGPREAGTIEVATFRSDGAYLDGRHPTGVTFTSPERDAQRRDFTINGLFYDPLTEQVHDFVGGVDDLSRGLIRAIREPQERFQEDKLRMLRAVRFAATFDFTIAPDTLQAIRELANEIVIVSAERIAAELRRMLVHPRRALALELLQQSSLLTAILPEASAYDAEDAHHDAAVAQLRWKHTLAFLTEVVQPDFPTSLALCLRGICHLPHDDPRLTVLKKSSQTEHSLAGQMAMQLCRCWKLSNEECDRVVWLIEQESTILAASHMPWPKLQRVLVHPYIESLLKYCAAVERVTLGAEQGVVVCREKLQLPLDELNPPLLLTGDALRTAGFQPSPLFKQILSAVRDAQLNKQIHTLAEALEWARHLHAQQ